jgi:RNA polymerase sigma-70 factor (ECF subfamily)
MGWHPLFQGEDSDSQGSDMNQPRGDTCLQALLDRQTPGDQANAELIAHAWQRLLLLTRKMLRNYPRLRRWEQTEDVFQTAALKLYQALRDVKPSAPAEFFGLAALQIRRTLIDLARHHFGPRAKGAAQSLPVDAATRLPGVRTRVAQIPVRAGAAHYG